MRFFCWFFAALLVFGIGLEWGVRVVTRQPWFREKVLPYAQTALNREVEVERLEASLSGLLLKGVKIAEAGGFENGAFLSAEKIRVRFSLWHLLYAHVTVHEIILDDAQVNIIRFKDGSLNVQTLASGEDTSSEETQTEETETEQAPFGLTLDNTTLNNLTVTYKDETDGLFLSANNLSFSMQHFSFGEEFPFTLSSTVTYGDSFRVPVGLYGKAHLGNFDFSKAYVEIVNLILKKDKTTLQIGARIDDWTHPVFSVDMHAKKVASAVADLWVKLPSFTVPEISFSADGEADLDNNLLKINTGKLTASGASVLAKNGQLDYQKNTYAALADAAVDFEELFAWLPSEWKEYVLEKGTLVVSAKVNQKQAEGKASAQLPNAVLTADGYYRYQDSDYRIKADIDADLESTIALLPDEYEKYGLKGNLKGYVNANTMQLISTFTVTQGGFFHPVTGHFSNVKADVSVNEKWDGSSGNAAVKLAGNLNQSPFTVDLTATQTPQAIQAEVNVYSKRVALPPAPPARENEQEEFVSDVSLEPVASTAWKLPPIHLKSNIQIDSLDAPYLYATGLVFTSDVEGLTPDLKNAQGVLKLTLGAGKILDLYKLTSANPLTKVLFLSLNVVGKVFNSLNVFSVLNGITKGVVSAVTSDKTEKDTSEQRMVVQPMIDENGKPVDMLVPYTDKKVKGSQAYDKFETEVKFADGVASVRKGTFVSNMISFRLDGTTDFNSGAIAMKVRAAPGKHEVNGVMPLTVNIGGTVDNPKGSMSMVGSVTSLVTQTVTKNVVSRNVHKGVKNFFRMFKTKDTGDETDETRESTDLEETDISGNEEETVGSSQPEEGSSAEE